MSEKDEDKVVVGLKKVPLSSEIEDRKRKVKNTLFVLFICIVFLVIGIFIGYFYNRVLHNSYDINANQTLGEIESLLDNYWIYSENYEDLQTDLENKAFYGMTYFEEDPYTTYMSAKELEEFATEINMDYVGIGVMYKMNNDHAIIQRVFVNSPAEKAGLMSGDIITKIDNKDVKGLTSSEIKELVLGEAGTDVIISVIRENVQMNFVVTRDYVDNSIYCYAQDDYVVMELSSFGTSTATECMSYLDEYLDYDKIIIDVRNNTGGYQTSVKEIAGLFIGDGKVYLRQKDSNGNEVADLTSCKKTYSNFKKIIILVNGETASAAEVFAICLKEQMNNVTLVGDNTYGKGVIQSTSYLSNGGVLKFSSYYWYSPNGVSIHKTGITPDVPVRQDDIAYEYYAEMKDDEKYEYDSVSDVTRLCQIALKYLDYEVVRNDGYFDENFENVLRQYKNNNNLGDDSILDKVTYESIIADAISNMSKPEKDYQFQKAIELIRE